MRLCLVHNHYSQAHLEQVVAQMREMGPPTIRAYDWGFDNLVQAIEGCHRLRACQILGLTPNIEYIDPKTPIADVEGLDYDGVGTLVGDIGDWLNEYIEIDG